MIAVDTNVLLRHLLDDDPSQAARVHQLFAGTTKLLLTDVVLIETIWTLKGKRYKAMKEDIVAVISALLEEPNVVFESQQAVWSALNDFMIASPVKTAGGVRKFDFPDALIVHKARIVMQHFGVPCEGVFTFDQAALQLDGTRMP